MPLQRRDDGSGKSIELEQELEQKLSSLATRRENQTAKNLAKRLGLPFSSLHTVPIDPHTLGILDEATARNAMVAVIQQSASSLIVAVTNPEDPSAKSALQQLRDRGFRVSVIVTTAAGIERAYKQYAASRQAQVFEVGAITIDESAVDELAKKIKSISDLAHTLGGVSATQLLEVVVAGGLATQASDVHFEPEQKGTRIRYRLDGMLRDVGRLSDEQYGRILNRIKVLSRLKLNVHKAPQDGRFTIRHAKTPIEVRTSVLPSEHGETVVLRLLDPRTINADLDVLGMRADLLAIVKEQLARPNGAILTTGPTGSGKTTTLYAFVNHLNSTDTKIITIEDPIEYHIKGVSQTQVDPAKGYTFATGLRAIVRQDPDIILVGEIRDAETADIALNAALTGHLVFSTVHTNDAAGTIPRLIDLGIKPAIIAPAIAMAMGQRLVRHLCEKCKKEISFPKDELQKAILQIKPIKERFKVSEPNEKTKIYAPGSCNVCNGTGYRGRVGVFELFLVTKDMEKLVLSQPAISEVRDLAIKEGMVTMLQDSYLKLLDGVTSLDEIRRVLG